MLSVFLRAQNKPDLTQYPFKLGEKMIYSMSYGWFEVGEAEVYIDKDLWEINGQSLIYIQCRVRSSGWLSIFTKLRICVDTWIDPYTLRPVVSSRDYATSKAIDIRTDRFEYADSVKVRAYVEDVDSHRFHVFPVTKKPIFDVLSSYLYLRKKASESTSDSDQIDLATFFTNELYPFSMKKSGTGEKRIAGQYFKTQRYELLFPETYEFPKDTETYVLTTRDSARIPLFFSMEMKYGDFTFELEDYETP